MEFLFFSLDEDFRKTRQVGKCVQFLDGFGEGLFEQGFGWGTVFLVYWSLALVMLVRAIPILVTATLQ